MRSGRAVRGIPDGARGIPAGARGLPFGAGLAPFGGMVIEEFNDEVLESTRLK